MYVYVYMSLPLRAEGIAIPSACQQRGGLFDELEKKGRLSFIFFVVFSTDTREMWIFIAGESVSDEALAFPPVKYVTFVIWPNYEKCEFQERINR